MWFGLWKQFHRMYGIRLYDRMHIMPQEDSIKLSWKIFSRTSPTFKSTFYVTNTWPHLRTHSPEQETEIWDGGGWERWREVLVRMVSREEEACKSGTQSFQNAIIVFFFRFYSKSKFKIWRQQKSINKTNKCEAFTISINIVLFVLYANTISWTWLRKN